ncbi:S-adenosylmethionine synthase [Pirellula sp. SH-Sr6A]|nr:S-adenosylmethionine synthase [Pirellula sp. SH-Sr6A]
MNAIIISPRRPFGTFKEPKTRVTLPSLNNPCFLISLLGRSFVASGKYIFTSESVSMGHPDKLADRISDSVLDALLAQDPMSRVACETVVTTGLALIVGEITTKAIVDYADVVRKAILDVGYDDDESGISGRTCNVMVALDKQSPDIAMGVDSSDAKDIGAGDQGLMFGYACNDTPEMMPLPIALAHRITNRLTEARFNNEVDWLRPDSKSQVSVVYDGFKPIGINNVVVSTQHAPHVSQEEIKNFVIEKVIKPCLPKELVSDSIVYHINPTGKFVVGGPHGDSGLTGRKIIVDTYGGWGRHGGGAFSGKDPTKVDRSAAYMARHVAKNIVASGVADRCEVQVAYAIGVSKPVSVRVDTQGSGKVSDEKICEVVQSFFDLTPRGIIEYLDLRRPIYSKTSSGGHFGRNEPEFTWEKTDNAAKLGAAILGK